MPVISVCYSARTAWDGRAIEDLSINDIWRVNDYYSWRGRVLE